MGQKAKQPASHTARQPWRHAEVDKKQEPDKEMDIVMEIKTKTEPESQRAREPES